jgi:probable HAF family extracellular repeat protein
MTRGRLRIPAMSTRRSYVAGAVLAASLLALSSTSGTPAARTSCSPSTTILESPRAHSWDVQAKAINDRRDVVGFADSGRGTRDHAILWKGGTRAGAVDLGVLRGYVSSEAYGVNNRRVVFGLLYDSKERAVPFRWENGRMTVLRGPNGQLLHTDNPGGGGRNAINSRGQMTWTMIVRGKRRAVRWTPEGKAAFLPALPGHAWTDAFSINDAGVVSGWSSKISNKVGEENPVLWDASGKVIPLRTIPGRADGIAEATNSSGLSVGVLGNLGTDSDPESDQGAVWQTPATAPLFLGRRRPYVVTEFVDVNERGQAAGTTGALDPKTGFPSGKPVIWQTGWPRVRPLALALASRRANPIVVPALNDINERGTIVGTLYGLARKGWASARRVDATLWTCQFGA